MVKTMIRSAPWMVGMAVALAPQAWAHCPVDNACGESALEVFGEVPRVSSTSSAPIPSYTATLPSTAGGAASSRVIAGPTVVNNQGAFDIVINAGPILAANPAALGAFNRAAAQWEAFIDDPVTVTIDADLAPLGPGVLGQSSNLLLTIGNFDTVRNALANDGANESDDGILAALPTAAQFSADLPVGFSLASNILATPANLRALGFDAEVTALLNGNGTGQADSTITFSSNFGFDFDNSNGVDAGEFDFESVALHEIGHSLGFTSAVDTVDTSLASGVTAAIAPRPLDLFRFEDGSVNDPETVAEFTDATRSLVPGSDDIFDQVLDVGVGDTEVFLATGVANGDGRQASHFRDGLNLGILDPTLAPGTVVTLSENDLRALDLIGFEIVVPEPTSACLLLGAGAALLVRRRGGGVG